MTRTRSRSKEWTPPAPLGVKETVAAKARKRRETQRALTEIRARASTRRRNDLAPSLQYEMAPTDSLKPATRQVRRRDERQRARIESSIDRFGICRPILIAADRTIIEGHGIWEAAKARGIAHVPCVVVDHLDPNDLRLLRIALNRLGETGAWSVEALRLEFEELTVLGSDLSDTGFEMAEIDTLLLDDDDEGEGSELATSALPGAFATSRLGDVWSLGDHRLIQGDAREAAVYDRLMDGSELASLVLTDEPFNVANVGHVTGNPDHREFAMAHGEMSREEFAAFNRAWMSAVLPYLVEGGLLATFIDWRSVDLVIASGLALELALLNLVVWEKSNGGQGSLWRSQHELLPVFKKGVAAPRQQRRTRPPRAVAVERLDLSRGLDPGIRLTRGPRFPPDGQAARAARGRAPRRDQPRRHRHRLLCRLGLDALGRGGGRPSLPRRRARRTLLRRHHPPLARDDGTRRRPRVDRRDFRRGRGATRGR